MPRTKTEKIYKIKKEELAVPEEIIFEEEPISELKQKLFPRLIPQVGRSVKLRDVFLLGGTASANPTVVTVSNTVTETNLKTFLFFSDEYYANLVIRLTALGVYSTANASDTVTLRVGLGTAPTTEINSIVSTAASVTNAPWNLTWYGIVATLGSSGTIEGQLTGHINNVQKDDANTATVTLNTTASQTLALTAQWSNNLAGNTISVRQFILEVLN